MMHLKYIGKKFDPMFKKRFPYLSGNKIFPLWIRMLHDNIGIKLNNIDKIPIPVDVHIARATFATGCLTGKYTGTIQDIAPKIDETWRKIIESINHPQLKYRLQMDEPLWHLSKYGCRYRKNNYCPYKNKCPVRRFCANGIINVSTEKVEIDTNNEKDKTSLNNFM